MECKMRVNRVMIQPRADGKRAFAIVYERRGHGLDIRANTAFRIDAQAYFEDEGVWKRKITPWLDPDKSQMCYSGNPWTLKASNGMAAAEENEEGTVTF